jgi:putative NADH-flavin reductase
MNQDTKVAVIGGTGKSGQYLVKQLISRGIPFKMLLRHPEQFLRHHPSIEVVKGDARNYEAIHALLNGTQAVISLLGQPKEESSIFSQATKNVLRAMHEYQVQRYIVTTGLNVDSPADKKTMATSMATEWMRANYPNTTADKQVEYTYLNESDINWTLVRLPLIEQTDVAGPVNISLEDCPGDKISATSLAHFIVEQLYSNTYSRQAPFIADAR